MTLTAHPYAEAWPLLAEDDLVELANDIAANGLRELIVRYDGMILDGRNRYAACQLAGVDALFRDFDGDDDAALAFVQSVNNERRHQSKGSRAASWALSMLAAGRRKDDGTWDYRKRQNSDALNREARRVLGVIADFTPDALYDVLDDSLTLNAAYEAACRERDAAATAAELEAQIEAEEAEALATLAEHAPGYAAKVGSTYSSARVALATWEDENRQAAALERQRKAEIEREVRVRREQLSRDADRLRKFIEGWITFQHLPERDDRAELLALLNAHDQGVIATIAGRLGWNL